MDEGIHLCRDIAYEAQLAITNCITTLLDCHTSSISNIANVSF